MISNSADKRRNENISANVSPIFVTQPSLPPLEEFIPYLEQIWQNKILTNGGPFHQQLEQALCDYLEVEYLSLFTNGTIALVTALQALNIRGEVITSPYSFVATTHSLLWNGITPVFADIDPDTLNLDPDKIEAAITDKTTAIMPVHCYGTPCNIDAIQKVADKYNLKVVFDAAHAFSVKQKGKSILGYGNLSVLSFHATKVFNTFEGGAIISPDMATKEKIDQLKNFGFVDEVTVVAPGINGKMSEFNSAFGLLQLRYFEESVVQRKELDGLYREQLASVQGIRCLNEIVDTTRNYSYFPIFVGSDYFQSRDELYERLKAEGVHSRRYFYPLISDFPMYSHLPSAQKSNLPVARASADAVLCLPIYSSLSRADVIRIAKIISSD